MSTEAKHASVAKALRNADLRRLLAAYLASVVMEWALWSALLVFAYERGGTTAAGLVSIGLFIPGVLIAPVTGPAADGPTPIRVLVLVFTSQTVMLGVSATAAFLNGPLLTVMIPAAVAVTGIAYVRPGLSVAVPGLVTSASDLTAANVLIGYCDSVCILVGPLLAAALIALDGPGMVIAVSAGLTLIGALMSRPLTRHDPGPGHSATHGQSGTRTHALIDGVRAVGERRGARQLLVVIGGQWVLIGALDLLYVVLGVEEFGLDASGPGLLGATFGVGAVIGAGASTILVARERLAPLLMVSMVVMLVALIALAGFTSLIVALIALPLVGLARSVAELTSRMLMQRAAPQDALASIFATMESLALTCSALGIIAVQVIIAAFGVRAAMLGIGVSLACVTVLTARRLVEIDASADAPVVTIRLLRRLPIFAPLPGPPMEGVARAGRHVSAMAGDTIIAEGDRGDGYFAIISGSVDVSKAGEHVRSLARGEGFGEVALMSDVPSTATVTAATDVELLKIERAPFLTAIVGHDASRQAALGIVRALTETSGRVPDETV